MPTDHRAQLARIKTFPQLIAYLRDEMGWPIENGSDFEDLTFEYTPDELGIDPKTAAKIQEIKRLRPLSPQQPWGIFFVKFEPKKLPVVALRRILSQVALKKRASANSAERAAWAADDLLFISNYGAGAGRQISFAHFSRAQIGNDLPTLKVLGWDNRDTALHLDAVVRELTEHLAWPDDEADDEAWRTRWRAAFTLGHREVITTSKQLSERLAELARSIRDRIKTALTIETEKGPLTLLMKAFRAALVHDLDADSFSDMYAQTIAYGLLSARIADPHRKTADDFAAHMRTNPFLRELMETFLKVGGRRGKAGGSGIDFDELGVSEVVNLLDQANMEAVIRDFGDRNPQEDPVIHFYEHFLAAYDKKQKVSRGVFYTPRPVVSYIVRSVDELLRIELGLEDGLADTTTWGEMADRNEDLKIPEGVSPDQDFVQILDPATGTGTFLVEVIDLIHKTLVDKWTADCQGAEKIDALWNEYVPRHLLPRLHGYELLMAPYAIAHLKVGLKLYETGYRFESEERARVYLTNALEPASDQQLTLDFLPALAHEAKAVNEIKRNQRFTVVIGNPPYSGHSTNTGGWISNLVHDYHFVDGTPLGERNPKWLQDDYVKFVRLCQYLVSQSVTGILGCITNHSYSDNPTFRGMRRSLMRTFCQLRFLDLHGNSKKKEKTPDGSTDENVFDIQQGVAILLANRTPQPEKSEAVLHSHLWGTRASKYSSLLCSEKNPTKFDELSPTPPFYLFIPQDTKLRSEFEHFPSTKDIFPVNNMGITTGDDEKYVAFDANDLVEKFNDQSNTKEFTYRPFDQRVVYYNPNSLARARLDFMRHMLEQENLALITIRRSRNELVANFFVGKGLIDKCFVSSLDNCQVFPLYILPDDGVLNFSSGTSPNLSPSFLENIAATLGLKQSGNYGVPAGLTPKDIFHYAYGVFHSPGYRSRYVEFLKIDFPRLPLTGNLEMFRALAKLGGELVALHVLSSSVFNKPITISTGPENSEVGRVGWSDGTVWLDAAKTNAREGHRATKPGTIGFQDVPEEVWDFHIGGYQVCHKWLKDRKGRALSGEDVTHYQKIIVALIETIRLMKEIDEIIEQHGGWPDAFQWSAE